MPGSDDETSPNCYAYEIDSPVNEQPGGTSGRIPTKWNDVNDVGKSVEADLKAKGYTVRKISGPDLMPRYMKMNLKSHCELAPNHTHIIRVLVSHIMTIILCDRLIPDNGLRNTGMVEHRFFGMWE